MIRGGRKLMSPIFILRNMIKITVKFAYIMGTQFSKLRLFFHKVFLISNFFFLFLHGTLYAGRIKFFAIASELLTHAVF